jgi:hypothetical protein
MELTFLGHQSWLLTHEKTNILIDPLLLNSFGHCSNINFSVYPPRVIDLNRIPKINAVILSHEHLDHFHIPSLAFFPKGTPCFISILMPTCVVDSLQELGFSIHKIQPLQTFQVGNLSLTFYPGSSDTIFWEKRVVQIYAQPKLDESGIFIAVDAILSEDFKDAVTTSHIPLPRVIVCSNNSQIVPPKAFGSHTNILPIADTSNFRNPGIELLHELLISYLKDLPPIADVVICGNGFIDEQQPFGCFLLSDNSRLAEIATELGLHQRVHGLVPGEVLNFDSQETLKESVDWIIIDEEKKNTLYAKQQRFLNNPYHVPIRSILGEFRDEFESKEALSHLLEELPFLARAMIVAPVGILSITINNYLLGCLGTQRVLLRFLEGPKGKTFQFALDLSRAEFVPDFTLPEDILRKFPFGIEMHLIDFVGILEGKLQIWDLAATGIRSWYLGDRYINLVAFLFCNYGEQVRPDLASKVYARVINSIRENNNKPFEIFGTKALSP